MHGYQGYKYRKQHRFQEPRHHPTHIHDKHHKIETYEPPPPPPDVVVTDPLTAAVATERFLAALRKSHEVYSYVDVISPQGETVRLPAASGDIKVDRTAAIRRSVSISCVDPLEILVPKGVNSILTPYGAELRPYRGIRHDNGDIEVYPLGVFRIAKVSVSDTTGGSPIIGIEGFDRSRTISRDKFTVPYVIAGGTNVITAIKDIIERTYATPDYDIVTTALTTTAPRVYDSGDDPWEACMELAQSMGAEIYFNANGWLTIATPVDMDSMPSANFTYMEGYGNTLLDLSQSYSDEPGYNGVIVVGESPGDELPPVRGEAWDDEPSSLTYRLGPYGEVPLFISDTLIKTEEDATASALGALNNLLGFSSQLDISAIVNPTYECGHIVDVVRERSNINASYAIDSFNVPLSGQTTQSLTIRQKRVI